MSAVDHSEDHGNAADSVSDLDSATEGRTVLAGRSAVSGKEAVVGTHAGPGKAASYLAEGHEQGLDGDNSEVVDRRGHR